jgi:hypothetical protein
MSLRTIKAILLVLIIGTVPVRSYAWSLIGHRVVGEIADSYLSADAKKEVKDLLGNQSIAMASNWMDFVKSDSAYDYLETWHYLSVKPGIGQAEFERWLQNDTSTNAYTKIVFVTKELKNKVIARETRAMYLRILIHLVGDIHQPMHVGRVEDQGGNKIRVLWFRDSVNLHQVWDERLTTMQQLSYTEYTKAINFTSPEQRKAWQREPLHIWFWQSYQHAEKIYADIKPYARLGYHYNYKYIHVVNEQLLKGGVHLAGLLNEIFD